MTLSRARNILLIVASWILFLGLGYGVGTKQIEGSISDFSVTVDRSVPYDRNVDFSLFWKTWDTLEASYYDPEKLQPSDMVYGAIKGMVEAVGDPYTIFLTPRENTVIQEDLSGNFEGVGIQIGFRGKQLAVVAPLSGTPAEEAGIEAGDFIIAIKDEEKNIERGTMGITLPEAVQLIRGKAGSIVNLTLVRDEVEEPISVDVVRRSIEVPSVALKFIGEDENIAHIKVTKFGGETKGEWNKAVLETLQNRNLAGVILDVRGNPGGYLQGAIDLASEFLESGEVVVSEERGDKTKSDFFSEGQGRLKGQNLVILINEGSASASEILAGALQDNLGTTLIGKKSFGKGTIQEPMSLDNGAGLHITIAKWLTPNGTWVNEEGVKPDIEVEDDNETKEDEQLDTAVEVLASVLE